MTISQFQINNPSYHLLAFEPRENQPGRVALKVDLPNIPPIPVVLVFDRNRAEELVGKLRDALDVAKGLKKI